MKKQDLLKAIDQELLDKLFGFCYVRTRDSYEAQELCSDITFALVEAAQKEGEVENLYAFLWRVARNVYADFAENRRRNGETVRYETLDSVADEPEDADDGETDEEALGRIFRSIAFLTRAYRDVMIAYYLDGLSAAEIAVRQNTSENTIRQRLFSARQQIRKEVTNMEPMQKPISLQTIDLCIWGTGNPVGNDPRNCFDRTFSKHLVWLCREKPRTAKELADALSVPTLYVEEELELLVKGKHYGPLRKTENGRYAVNIALFDEAQIQSLWDACRSKLPELREGLLRFVEAHREEYLAVPFRNRKTDLPLILWEEVKWLSGHFENAIADRLSKRFFPDATCPDRPFTVFGFRIPADGNVPRGCGVDGIYAADLCGYAQIELGNNYCKQLSAHFHCEHNISLDPVLLLAVRAVNGIDVHTLSEADKEHAAKAIEVGYLYREGDTLYTKFLVCDKQAEKQLRAVTKRFGEEMTDAADALAEAFAPLLRAYLPAHLLGEYEFAMYLATLPVFDLLTETLIDEGLLTVPENNLGAEGILMTVTDK